MALSNRDRRLLQLFAAVVVGDWDEVARARREAPAGEPDRAWRETVLQAHVFAGFPRVVEAYGVLETAGGLGELEPGESETSPAGPSDAQRTARGRELFQRIYGDHAPRVRDSLERSHPDFARWIEAYAYGGVLARPGLSADRRELLAVAALAVLGQDRQLASHARGALECGATVGELREAFDAVRDRIPRERLARAERVIERFAR